MRNYLKLKCTVCGRKKDVKVDTRSSTFPKCTITLGCSGVLTPLQYTDSPDTITDAAPSGIQNWYSRFTNIVKYTQISDPSFPISYSDDAEVFIAVKLQDITPDDSYKLKVTMQSPSIENKQFREYVFNTTAQIDKLVGVESGVGKKVLRFISTGPSPEEITVFKNGVKLNEGSAPEDYLVSRSTNNVQQNAIIFNSPIRGTNQFKIIVSRPVSERTIVVEFDKLTEFDSVNSCWGNINAVSYRNEMFYIFFKKFSGVPLSSGQEISIVQVDLVKDGPNTIPLSNCIILFSGGPTKIDRVLTASANLDTLASIRYPIEVTKSDNTYVLSIKERYISEKYPPMITKQFIDEGLLKSSVENAITDTISSSKVVAPLK